MRRRLLFDLFQADDPPDAGGKAKNLRVLRRYGCQVPAAFGCALDAWRRYRSNDPTLLPEVREELNAIIDQAAAYSVRSSANLEDSLESSFAGQFATVLDVRGAEAVEHAMKTVWESAGSAAVRSYARRLGRGGDVVEMGVIIQRMVPARYSGVAFSRNPMTGLSEVVVEAVRGTGEKLVQQGITPDRWVSRWGGWTVRPESPEIPDAVIRDVVSGAKDVERRHGKPVDLEWAYDGEQLHWLQMREITSLAGVAIYSNRMSRELLPGMIKPLIWSINIPLVNGAWVRLLTELIGKNSLDPQSLAKQFYYRAYFNMGALGEVFTLLGMPRESLELLMGFEVEGGTRPRFAPTLRTVRHVPRMIHFVWNNVILRPRVERFLVRAKADYGPYLEQEPGGMEPGDILATIRRLFALNQQTAYQNIVVPLLMQTYHRLLKKHLTAGGVDYESVDVKEGDPAFQEFNPNAALAEVHRTFERLGASDRERVASATFQEFAAMQGIEEFQGEVRAFLSRFGHLSNVGVDFSAVPWRETPDIVLRMIIGAAPESSEQRAKARFDELPVGGIRRRLLHLLWHRARLFMLYREQVGSLYTQGYGLFRKYYLALADELVRRGLLGERGDIFFLRHEEVESMVEDRSARADIPALVAQRRREMEECSEVDVPEVIYGDSPPPVVTRGSEALKGIPTSRGYYQGPVRVVRGIEEYTNLKDGDVLVIPFSDVGLTPLFAHAGAVVSESGGILSHSSIVAREYGIPAVVSAAGACKLEDGTLVGVDGFTGEVHILGVAKGG